MSKKILAIALFATMVLSLFPVLGPAPTADALFVTTATDANGDRILQNVRVYAANTLQYDNDDSAKAYQASYTDELNSNISMSPTKNLSGYNTGAGVSGGTITLKGKYADLQQKYSDYIADKLVQYDLYFVFPEFSTSTNDPNKDGDIKIISFNGGSGSISMIEKGVQKGQYGLRTTITLNKGGTTEKTVSLVYEYNNKRYTVEVKFVYEDTTGSSKPEQGLLISKVAANPTFAGDYSAQVLANTLFIDYASPDAFSPYTTSSTVAIAATTTNHAYQSIKFRFTTIDGTPIPAKGKLAYVVNGGDDYTTSSADASKGKFFNFTGYNTDSRALYTNQASDPVATGVVAKVEYDKDVVLPIWVNGATSFKIAVEDENYLYKSGEIKIQMRPVPRNQITNVLFKQGRDIKIVLGETVALEINPAFPTTYTKITLRDIGMGHVVAIDDLKLTGATIGTTTVQVINEQGTVIDNLYVTVVAKDAEPAPSEYKTYRVISRTNLNKRGAPISGAIVGKFAPGATFQGKDSGTVGWIAVSDGTFVSAAYAMEIASSSTTAGNYVVRVSTSLNARSTPGGAKAGSFANGTVLSIVAFSGTWAQTSTGVWVSTSYIVPVA